MTENIAAEVEKLADTLAVDRKRSIGEIAKELKVETHVIRFWEENFPQIKPEIGTGNRRYYYNKQLRTIKRIKKFLYEDGYTIAGLQKLLKKRKRDGRKDEDLNVIVREGSKPSKTINLHDFIDPEVEIQTNSNVDLQEKIMRFAKIKIAEMDPKIREEIRSSVKNIRRNLEEMRSIFK